MYVNEHRGMQIFSIINTATGELVETAGTMLTARRAQDSAQWDGEPHHLLDSRGVIVPCQTLELSNAPTRTIITS